MLPRRGRTVGRAGKGARSPYPRARASGGTLLPGFLRHRPGVHVGERRGGYTGRGRVRGLALLLGCRLPARVTGCVQSAA